MEQIRCPHCNGVIDIDEVLYSQVRREAEEEVERMRELYHQEHRKRMEELEVKERELRERAERELQRRLEEERRRLEERVGRRLEREYSQKIELLERELEEKRSKMVELHKMEVEVERLKREKEEALYRAQVEAERKLSQRLEEERERLQEQIFREMEVKLKEKDIQLEQLRRELERAHQKAEQGSQQLKGEAQEVLIEEWLRNAFPLDTIQEVKKGSRGGDCIQIVNDRTIPRCGTIYYESKRTKEFNRGWIEKLKRDMREIGADVGVLVTQTMPKELERMGLLDGVWVCSFQEFKALSLVLRENLIKLAYVKRSQENRQDKMGLLYAYLTSEEFRMQIEAIVEGFVQMQEELNKEKRAIQKIWKQREKQIEKVLESTISMYGAIKGIAGNAIPHVKGLELPYEP
ncbi:MAG: DUF2130 domain-containing protein [Epsilonproteobacteria bacterium]|nr:DUF2130 domain-containing protein [Campylobacterota bacterium]NPA57594.1 DUF2130 domain-containing protein [Campylobacterota bacterium]